MTCDEFGELSLESPTDLTTAEAAAVAAHAIGCRKCLTMIRERVKVFAQAEERAADNLVGVKVGMQIMQDPETAAMIDAAKRRRANDG